MPRRGYVAKRDIIPDPLYESELVTRMINKIMWRGKRRLAESVMYDAMGIMKDKLNEEPLQVVEKALNNVMPIVEVKPRRVGGATYQVPMEVRPERRSTLGMRWIVQAARARSEHTMKERLANELMDAYNGTGSAVKRREDTHRMAEANRAFAHYRW